MACASEDVLHEINDLSKDGLEQVNSEILSFESKEDFSNALEKFGKNPLTRTASSFISAENIYEEGSIDNESLGFLVPDDKFRHFLNKDLEIIVNDTIYKINKEGTFYTAKDNIEELYVSMNKVSDFKLVSNKLKKLGNIKLIDSFETWNSSSKTPITDEDFFDDDDDEDDIFIEEIPQTRSSRTTNKGDISQTTIDNFPVMTTVNVSIVDKVIRLSPKYLGHSKYRFKSDKNRKLYVSLYRYDYGFGVSVGLDCKVMKKLWHGMKWGHMVNWDEGIYYGLSSLMISQKLNYSTKQILFKNEVKKVLDSQMEKIRHYTDINRAGKDLNGGIVNHWNPYYNKTKPENGYVIPVFSNIGDFFDNHNMVKGLERELIRQGFTFLKGQLKGPEKQGVQLSVLSEDNETIYNLFSNDISWNGGGYRVRDEFLNYYKDVVFSFSVNGDNIKPGLKISDNDFIGSPKIEACEAIVYTKDGGGWIGVKIIKELNN